MLTTTGAVQAVVGRVHESFDINGSFKAVVHPWMLHLAHAAQLILPHPVDVGRSQVSDNAHTSYHYERLVMVIPRRLPLVSPRRVTLFKIIPKLWVRVGTTIHCTEATLYEPSLYPLIHEAIPDLLRAGPVTFDVHLTNAFRRECLTGQAPSPVIPGQVFDQFMVEAMADPAIQEARRVIQGLPTRYSQSTYPAS